MSGCCLLNPGLRLNSLIYINSRLLQAKDGAADGDGVETHPAQEGEGIYRVIRLAYTGDTHGNEWKTAFEAVTQSGVKPAMLTRDADNPWR